MMVQLLRGPGYHRIGIPATGFCFMSIDRAQTTPERGLGLELPVG